ncbi:MAG: MATE family efflux transporter, partial [Lachnospiraceae bacterium]
MSTRIRQKNGWESYKAILALAIPIIIQNLFSAAVSSADVIMLNSVGQSAVSASSLAVQYTNVLYMIFYGLGTGSTMLCAQYWGKKD